MADLRFLNPITILADIGGISIDVLKRRESTHEHIISQNPIEDGSPVTDHVTNLPPKIILEGGFSDIRITNLLGTILDDEKGFLSPDRAKKGRAKEQFDKLLELFLKRESFQVMDGLHLYKDMQFKSLKESKEKEGFSVTFTAELWQIRKVKLGATQDESKIKAEIDAANRQKVAIQLLSVAGVTTPLESATISETLIQAGILA